MRGTDSRDGESVNCVKCGNPDASGYFCSLCGAELAKATQAKLVEPKQDPKSEKIQQGDFNWAWLGLGLLAGIGWLVYMTTPIWGKANPFYVLGLRESDFGEGGSPLGRYLAQIALTSVVLLSITAFSFYKSLSKSKD